MELPSTCIFSHLICQASCIVLWAVLPYKRTGLLPQKNIVSCQALTIHMNVYNWQFLLVCTLSFKCTFHFSVYSSGSQMGPKALQGGVAVVPAVCDCQCHLAWVSSGSKNKQREPLSSKGCPFACLSLATMRQIGAAGGAGKERKERRNGGGELPCS